MQRDRGKTHRAEPCDRRQAAAPGTREDAAEGEERYKEPRRIDEFAHSRKGILLICGKE